MSVRRLLKRGFWRVFVSRPSPGAVADLDGEWSEKDPVPVSIQEAARRAEVSASTIRTWIETGRMEAFRLEGDRRVYVYGLEQRLRVTCKWRNPVHLSDHRTIR